MLYTRILILLLLLKTSPFLLAQETNSYGLKIISDPRVYRESTVTDSNTRLVEIKRYIPNIKLDIRYATADNFSKQAVYTEARAFARLPVVHALQKIQAELNRQGLGLKIYDAYRPYSVTVKFFQIASDKSFVAHPKTGSRHNRGCAVDLTLIRMHSGKELKMPTPYDSFAPEASPGYTNLPRKIRSNRQRLINIMEKYGFKVLHNEWWHFDFNSWKEFDLMDIPFKQL